MAKLASSKRKGKREVPQDEQTTEKGDGGRVYSHLVSIFYYFVHSSCCTIEKSYTFLICHLK